MGRKALIINPARLEELAVIHSGVRKRIASDLGCSHTTLDLKLGANAHLRDAYDRGCARVGVRGYAAKGRADLQDRQPAPVEAEDAPEPPVELPTEDGAKVLMAIKRKQRTYAEIIAFTRLDSRTVYDLTVILEEETRIKSRYELPVTRFYLYEERLPERGESGAPYARRAPRPPMLREAPA